MSKKLKVIGLSMMAVCAFGVVSASGAQAAVHWNVNGAALGTGATEKISTTTTVTKFGSETTPSLTLTVTSLLQVTCTELHIEEGIITGPKTDSATKLIFTHCVVKTTTGGSTKCTVTNSGGTLGTIETAALVSELKEVSGSAYDIFTPKTGTAFVTLVIAPVEGSTCALSGTNTVSGSTAIKIPVGTNAKALEGESSEAIAKAAGTKLLYGTRESFLDGKVDLTLVSGNTWGVGL